MKLAMVLDPYPLVFAGDEHPLFAWLVLTWWGGTTVCSLKNPADPLNVHFPDVGDPLGLKHLKNVSFIPERI